MKIYLVERTDYPLWDEVHSMVVQAEDEEQARRVHPREDSIRINRDSWGVPRPLGSTEGGLNLSTLKVTELGTARSVSKMRPCVLHIHYERDLDDMGDD